jgi:SpoVK/Ycf46/Vps4 family AAA+-type ATPase
LLQAVDDWPEHGLLIAATNHPELLDPAVWRRFDRIIEFPFPTTEELTSLITNVLDNQISEDFSLALSIVFTGKSFSDVVKLITNAKRKSIISHEQITDLLIDNMREECKRIEKNNKYRIAELLINQGISERKVSDITGVSRDTLRKHRHQTNPKDCEANSECQGM